MEIDVPRQAQGVRPTHFSVSLGNEPLPHALPVAASMPPATAPIVSASPVMPATAAWPAPSLAVPPGQEPMRVPPPSSPFSPSPSFSFSSSAAPARAEAYRWPSLIPRYPGTSLAPASSAYSKVGGTPPLNPDAGKVVQPDRPWLGMCLLVIALVASNAYIGWLFWDARQRYRGLLTRAFSLGQPATEA